MEGSSRSGCQSCPGPDTAANAFGQQAGCDLELGIMPLQHSAKHTAGLQDSICTATAAKQFSH